ncbi:Leucine-rich repeat-containing G protein-coupled receptor 4 [Carabus blaptoides fortunei]
MTTSSSGCVLLLCLTVQIVTGCDYNADEQRTHCSALNKLEDTARFPHTKRLNVVNFGNESYGPIKKDTFKGMSNVVDLQVKGLANEIESGAFDGLTNLYELHLDDNNLHIIPSRAFANLPIEVIYVYFCQVKEIRPKAFDRLSKLRYAYFYGNFITQIEQGVFTNTNISHLIMRKNGIKTVEDNAFADMENLVHLSLEENHMTSFEPQLAIGPAPKMTHLYINRNKLSKVRRNMFTGMPNLQVILLNINRIERFGNQAFVDLRNLGLLDISNNVLEEIETNVFHVAGMKHLQLLFVHDNKLSFLSSETGLSARNTKCMVGDSMTKRDSRSLIKAIML